MIELFMIACLKDAPTVCAAHHLSYSDERMTVMQLMATGQQELAKWACEHPQWFIQRYGARRAGQEAKA